LKRILNLNSSFEVQSFGRRSVNFLDRQQTFELVSTHKPDWVLLSAAQVGGIHANQSRPLSFISNNLQIQTNLLDASAQANIKNLIFFGSSCIYPRESIQPIKEENLMRGQLEDSNKAYAMAKIAGVFHANAIRDELDLNYFTVMPTNLYGDNDNFDEISGHVLPSLISKFTFAKNRGIENVVLWGDGTPMREFLHADDLSRAIQTLVLNGRSQFDLINIGTGKDITISDLAQKIAQATGYNGQIVWNTEKPNGTPRKVLDVSRMLSLGWKPQITLDDGIRRTLNHFQSDQGISNE
jgi:GDP-L-fucose synthase